MKQNSSTRRLRGAFGIDSASFKGRSGWLNITKRRRKLSEDAELMANGSRWYAEDPEAVTNLLKFDAEVFLS